VSASAPARLPSVHTGGGVRPGVGAVTAGQCAPLPVVFPPAAPPTMTERKRKRPAGVGGAFVGVGVGDGVT
jgi:hypothetical protein